MERKLHWLRGDCHLHTTNSDGNRTPEQLYEMLYQRGLDFAFITDHNYNTVGTKTFNYKGVTVIPGMEITGDCGHVNVFGEDLPYTKILRPHTKEEYYAFIDLARARGAHVSVNHPHDRRFGWQVDIDTFNMDTVEVWNAPMHNDNITCMDWWVNELLKGRFIPAIGGSDFHQDYAHITHLLASPTTYVYAYSNSYEDILEAMKAGRVFVTNSPSAAKLFLTVGDAVPGQSVKLEEGVRAEVFCEHLFKGQTLRIYNNDKLIDSYTADKKSLNIRATADITEPGFVRAEVRTKLPEAGKKAYAFAAGKLHYHNKGEDVPDFIYSFTNPVFIK